MTATDPPWTTRRLRWPAEAAAVHGWLGLTGALPVAQASDLGARIGATLGPRVPYSRRALANMRLALPDLDAAAHGRILREMWANLGRQAAEYAHLETLGDPAGGYIEIEGLAHLREVRAGRAPAVAVSAHFSGFEAMQVLLSRLVSESVFIVRQPNNPRVVAPLDLRRRVGGGRTSPKGRTGGREALRVLNRNGLVVILADQRMSDGIQAPFFGHMAGTPAGPAQMALRHGAPLLPVRIARVAPLRFRLTIEPPLPLPEDGDAAARRLAITSALNRRIESWIAAHPADWLWLHRRWPKETYRGLTTDAATPAVGNEPDGSR
jgi:KDO2-lipid IV(A) lauroyltransferase